MEKEIFDKLSDRKKAVLLHYEKTLASPLLDGTYIFAQDDIFDDVDYILLPPGDNYEYYTLSTVGLSAHSFNPHLALNELTILLPPSFEPNLKKEANAWPLSLIREVVHDAISHKVHFELNKIYHSSFESSETDCVGGIVTLPEMMDMDFLEEEIDGEYTRFFLFVPLNEKDILKAQDVGIARFVEFDLHDINGPVMTAPYSPPAINKKLQSIIAHNEKNLKK